MTSMALLLRLMNCNSPLKKSHLTSPGPDDIHQTLINHLNFKSLTLLLSLFNRIWTEGTFPTQWTRATILPILKPGKEPQEVTSYRPIALTSCLCKTMERMVNAKS
ncbi:putative RNA-directed DNA polymerase from transposon X-element [Caerostris extrusa]|uniref:RNA-directed DNA polymerase from transposon X-element n=1 Tax=Caerostris extrusa TaxID=172846 RepID=A0AAV4XPL8_CAEEX|nr:putative RNA-directed DNA polymerase from transposon X-element [Caerostris extrusa]